MTRLVTSEKPLSQVTTPSLPLAPVEYTPRYIEQLNNVLRLYFTQVNKIIGQLKAEQNYTAATLPSAVTYGAGSRLFVTDALAPVFGSTVVGGGTVNVPVYSDGTNWKVG